MSDELHQSTAALKKKLESAGVQYCFAAYVDVHGIPKSKCVPISKFEELCAGGELYTVGAVEGMGLVGPQEDECATIPDLNSCVVFPWDKRFAWLNADTHYHGHPYPGDSRVILQKILTKAKEMGFIFHLGIEPEFYVLKKNADGKLAPLAPVAFKGPNACYDVSQTLASMQFLDPMCKYIEQLGWGMHSFDQECGKGQYEFDFHFADALTIADRFIFLRFMAKQVAESIGAIATFMPKPFSNRTGTGSHFHISIGTATAKNAFYDKSDPRGLGLTQLGYWFLGGLLHHARALAAICAPSVNSYKRLVVGRSLSGATWAPAYIAYGDNNRTACVRIPFGRIELRLPDGAANPYLATAALAAAGLDGIDRRLDPGEPLNINLYELTPDEIRERGIGLLPQSLSEAVDALAADEVVKNGIGAQLAEEFIRLKRMEWIEYSRHVGEWETERYLEMF